MTLDELFSVAYQVFPQAHVSEDMDGEIIIHTGLMWDAPLGFNGCGPQNIPHKVQPYVELRELTHEDIK